MKRSSSIILLNIGLFFLFSCSSAIQTVEAIIGIESPPLTQSEAKTESTPEQTISDSIQEELVWPRLVQHEDGTLTLYQPQVDHWDEKNIEAQMAIEILLQGEKEPRYGSVRLKGESDTNLDERLVQISRIEVSGVHIPSAKDPQKVQELEKFINFMLKDTIKVVALDRILADVATKPEAVKIRTTEVSMEPPTILVSTVPAAMLGIDGEPLHHPIADIGLEVIVNANMDLYYASGLKTYYLFVGDQWLSTSDLKGNWENTSQLPQAFQQIPDDHERAYIKDLLKTNSEQILSVLVTKPPAELILIDGEPSLEGIAGTSILYVTNTEQDLFLHREEGLWYYMSSGRWFRAKRLEGEWVAASDDLPSDFGKIPEEHAKGPVLLAVPGTERAKEAVIEAQIPQKITVKRDETTATVEYQGEPQFIQIEGINVEYALNTDSDVFKVGTQYYLCFQGIWFLSSSATGPWTVCDSIPDNIYNIPATHPKYNVTYVKVYEYTADTVTFGYASGYTGIYVNEYDTLVYGTGYTYTSYTYYYGGWPYYYWYPSTYWSFGFRWGWGWGWGRYSRYYSPHYYGRYNYSYGRYGQRSPGDYQARAASGTYKGADVQARQVKGPYEQWGAATVSRNGDWVQSRYRAGDQGTAARLQTSRGDQGVAIRGNEGQGGLVKGRDNNMYVAKDGNVYRHDENGWASRENNQWSSFQPERSLSSLSTEQLQSIQKEAAQRKIPETQATTPNSTSTSKQATTRPTSLQIKSSNTYQQLQQDRSARSRGNYRTNISNTARSRSMSRPSRGGGRGGGRR